MLGVWTRGLAVLRPCITVTPTRAVNVCFQARISGRTLVTGATTSPSISSHSPLLSACLRSRTPWNLTFACRQVRLNSTGKDVKSSPTSETATPAPESSSNQPKPSVLSRIFSRSPQGISSFKKIVALARPEKKPLLIAIGLLLVSSAVSLSVPFAIGRLIDFFSSPNPVSD